MDSKLTLCLILGLILVADQVGGKDNSVDVKLDDSAPLTNNAIEAAKFLADEFSQQAESKEQKNTYLKSALKFVRTLTAPVRDNYRVIQAYRSWLQGYTQFKDTLESEQPGLKLRSPAQLVRLEYAKLDKRLMEDACAGDQSVKKKVEVENMDFVWQILRKLIARLENHLEELKQSGGKEELLAKLDALAVEGSDEQTEDQNALEDDARNAIDRAKRIAAFALGRRAAIESVRLGRIIAMNSLANLVVASQQDALQPSTGVLAYLAPVILLLGTPNASAAFSYLQDIQFRFAMQVIKGSIDLVSMCRSADRV